MEFKTLEQTGLSEIVDCLLEAFSGYFVPMPTEVAFWEKRFRGARADFSHSVGVFDKGKIVAFIIHCIDQHEGQLTAFNTGTGVIPAYRGQALVDQMYQFIIPTLRDIGIKKYMLEVIQKNVRAIKVYERIGFSITRKVQCFKGSLTSNNSNTALRTVSFDEIIEWNKTQAKYHSWDNSMDTIKILSDTYRAFEVLQNQQPVAYFIINPTTGYLAQFNYQPKCFKALMDGIGQIAKNVRINNVDEADASTIGYLLSNGFKNTINQYEMEMRGA